MAKRILLWDPRFPGRDPLHLSVHDDIASAAVRAGVAAAADPAEAGALAAGAAVDRGMPTLVTLQHGLGMQSVSRVALPLAVAQVAVALGLAASDQPIGSLVYVPLGPATASFQVSASAGSDVFTFTGLSAGETVTSMSPNDGRLAVGGGGTKIVVGLTASSASTVNYTFATSAARTLVVTVTAAAETPVTDATKLISGMNVSGYDFYNRYDLTYDMGQRTSWTDQNVSTSQPYLRGTIHSLFDDYCFPVGTTTAGSNVGWNTTTDGSTVVDSLNGNPSRPSIKMDLDGTIDTANLASLGITQLNLWLSNYYSAALDGIDLQVTFTTAVPGAISSDTSSFQLINEDGGVGKVWRIHYLSTDHVTKLITIPVNGQVPAKIKRPTITPHPNSGKVTNPAPVGNPFELANLKQTGKSFRWLDVARINGRTCGGDTPTALAYVSQVATDYLFNNSYGQPVLPWNKIVAISNEMGGKDIHYQIAHRDGPAMWTADINALLQATGAVTVEYSNEVWNQSIGRQFYDVMIQGLRNGYAGIGLSGQECLNSADAIPETIRWYGLATNPLATQADLQTGDKIWGFPANGYGFAVFRARKAMPAGSLYPKSYPAGGNTAAVSVGELFVSGVNNNVYRCIQAIPPNAFIDRGNTAYFEVNSASVDDRPWDLVYNNNQCIAAGRRFRTHAHEAFCNQYDAAALAAGKAPCKRLINCQPKSVVVDRSVGSVTGNATEAGEMLAWDNAWQRNTYAARSIYAFLSGGHLDNDYRAAGNNPGVTLQDKWNMYANTIGGTAVTGMQAVQQLADKLLSDVSIASITSDVRDDLAGFLGYGAGNTNGLQQFFNAKRAAWNADPANASNQMPFKQAIGAVYEGGVQVAYSKNMPESVAKVWSASTNYTAGFLGANFAWVGATISGDLYRAKADNVNVNPVGNPDTWELVPGAVDIDGVTRVRAAVLNNLLWRHPRMNTLINAQSAMFRQFCADAQAGYGLYNHYQHLGAITGAPSDRFGFRTADDITSPAWVAAIEVNTAWNAAPSIALSSVAAQSEGASGTTAFVYTLTLTRNGSTAAFPYTWAVTGIGANPADANDFGGTFPSGSGTFATGETTKTITVNVSGDAALEPDEMFRLTVTSTGAGTATANGTILNDDTSATAFAQTAHMVSRFSAIDIPTQLPGQANNTALAAWIDKIVTSTVATAAAGNEPKFLASSLGGKPGVRWDGTTANAMNMGKPSNVVTALNGTAHTVVMVLSNVGASTYGPVLCAGTGANLLYAANGVRAGAGVTSVLTRNGALWPPSADMLVLTIVYDSTDGHDKIHIYINGGCVSQDIIVPKANTDDIGIGGTVAGTIFRGAFTLHELITYDIGLGLDDVQTNQKAACDLYGHQAYPWANAPAYLTTSGSSLETAQEAVSPEFGAVARLAAALGLTYGQYSIGAYGGATATNCISKYIPRIARMPAIHGKPHINVHLEWFNSRDSPSIITDTVTIGNMLKASGIKPVITTSTDYGSGWSFAGSIPRTGAGSFSDHDWVGSGAWDAVVNSHLDPNIGVPGCAPAGTSGGNTYFASKDNVHLTGNNGTCGAQVLAGLQVPVVAPMFTP